MWQLSSVSERAVLWPDPLFKSVVKSKNDTSDFSSHLFLGVNQGGTLVGMFILMKNKSHGFSPLKEQVQGCPMKQVIKMHLECICQFLGLDGAKLLALAMVSSCFDYCNSLLSGIVDKDLTKLQRVPHWLALVVIKSPSFARSFPLLCFLHWLTEHLE